MKAIYQGKLYNLKDQAYMAILEDLVTREELIISFGDPDLIVDPTDDEINDLSPEWGDKEET